MAKVNLYNNKGEKTGELDLRDEIFAVNLKSDLVHQVYTAMRANAREPWADSKDKGEVSGGGKKPWKQKGTGRARHGSIRSPLWKGGGVTFGPLSDRVYKQKINKKMNKLAIKMCLSDKVAEGKLIVVENYPTESKTKILSQMFSKLPNNNRNTLMVLGEKDKKTKLTVRNLSKLNTINAIEINVVDLLHHQYVVVEKDSLSALEKRLS